MSFDPPPETAAWRHLDARAGFEVVYFRALDDGGHLIEGCTTAVEDGRTWIVDYAIAVDPSWLTRHAEVTTRSETGTRQTVLDGDGEGHWQVDGAPAPFLDGCLDVDLESSALTNTFPIHRLRLSVGEGSDAPAAYVRALDLTVERLDQHYTRLPHDPPGHLYAYSSPTFDFACDLLYDNSGLVQRYPGIAVRAC